MQTSTISPDTFPNQELMDPRLSFLCGSNTDVCLIAGGKEFYVKKSVLSARSWYFRAMFARNWLENSQSKLGQPIYLEEISADLCKTILHFLYTGKTCFPEAGLDAWFQNFQEIMLAANYFGIQDEIEGSLGIYMRKFLSINSVFDMWLKSRETDSEVLSHECERYFIDNFSAASQTNDFLLCPREFLYQVLRRGDIDCHPDEILEKLIVWAQFNIRKESLTIDPVEPIDINPAGNGSRNTSEYKREISETEIADVSENMEMAIKRYLVDLLPPRTLFSRPLKCILLNA